MLDSIKSFFGFSPATIESDSPLPFQDTEESLSTSTPQPVSTNGFKGTLISGTKGTNTAFPSAEIKVQEPQIYEDSLTIATYLREKKPVLVNLKHLDSDTGKRLIDFVCGTAYAINGHMMKIGETIFLFTPEDVLIVDSNDQTPLQQGMQQEESSLYLQHAIG